MTTTDTNEKLDFKRLLPIIFIVFVDLMGLTIIIPILPYYTLAFDAGPWAIGLLAAAYPLMQLLGGPVLSSLSDQYGRKRILAFAQVGTFFSLLLLGFANALWVVFLARILDGITGANLPTVQAAISDVTTPKTRSQGFGLIGAAFGMGFILGPALSGIALALTNNNYSAPAFLAACFAFVSVMLTTFVFEETLPPEKRGEVQSNQRVFSPKRLFQALLDPVLGILFGLLFVQQLVFAAFQIMFAPFTLNRLGLNSLGNTIFFVFVGVLSVIVQGGLIGKLTARFGERRLVIGGMSLVALGLLLMSATPQTVVPWYSLADMVVELQQGEGGVAEASAVQLDMLPPEDNRGLLGITFLLIAIIPLILGSSVLQPSFNSLITQNADPTRIGAVLGISSGFMSLANVLGPLWGGAAFDFLAPAAPFIIGGIIIVLVVPLAVTRVPKPV
ncbi:MAG TPA: MFS transporter [Anaerolineae bacterium]|nr:MFS transporter [Anaerolineae bacterium]